MPAVSMLRMVEYWENHVRFRMKQIILNQVSEGLLGGLDGGNRGERENSSVDAL